MISLGWKKVFILGIICTFLIGIGLVPFLTPPYISHYSHINWNGADLAKDMSEDSKSFEDFPNFTKESI